MATKKTQLKKKPAAKKAAVKPQLTKKKAAPKKPVPVKKKPARAVVRKETKRPAVMLGIRQLKAIQKNKGSFVYPVSKNTRVDLDTSYPIKNRRHDLVYQQGKYYGEVGDCCDYLTDADLLRLQAEGVIEIQYKNNSSTGKSNHPPIELKKPEAKTEPEKSNAGAPRNLSGPEELGVLWERYKTYVQTEQNQEWKRVQYVGKDGDRKTDAQILPYTMQGFKRFVYPTHGIIHQYFDNNSALYPEFLTICTRIEDEIQERFIIGGSLSFFNPAFTARVAGIADKVERTHIEQPFFD